MRRFVAALPIPFLMSLVALVALPGEARSEDEAPVALPKGVSVELIDPGAEPRQPLRYVFKEGLKEIMVMDTKVSMTQSVSGMAQPRADLPTMRMVMEIKSDEITEEGHLRYSLVLTETELLADGNPQAAVAMRAALKSMEGMSGSGTVSTRGVNLGVEVNLPEDVDPAMARSMGNWEQSLDQMCAPLPEEPVGVGAVWNLRMDLVVNGIRMQQVAKYKLVSVDHGVAKLEIGLEQTAGKQKMDVPGAPSGMTAELQSLLSKGSGTAEFDLTRLVPDSVLKMSTVSETVITLPGRQVSSTTNAEVGIKVKPRAVTVSEDAPSPEDDSTPEDAPSPEDD